MSAACTADLREELLARAWGPTIRATSRRDAELAAEMHTLETARRLMPPDDWELDELVPDPRCGPPDGADAWLADLPAELLFEYIAATELGSRHDVGAARHGVTSVEVTFLPRVSVWRVDEGDKPR